jgi:ribonucleotide reductase alpha subunit
MSLINENGSIVDPYRNFIHVSRYSRWIEEKGRRETWVETVDRYIDFMKEHLVKNHNYKENDIKFSQVREAILNHKVMPSMRSLMTAGSALERDHIAAYNCSFIAVDSLRSFDEAMYILMNGTGVGFSVEQKYVDNLPAIAEELFPTNTTIVVEDSKLGWAKAYKELIGLLVTGQIPNWDMSKVRPAGARLKTFGGRASGPEPLNDLFKFTVEQFKIAKGRRLKPIEAHDIMCKVGEVVVVGGVRRSALISLSNLDDFEMAKAKSGQWWETEGQRALANNSAVYNSKPNTAQFLREWRNLYESKSGERGIYNMDSVRKHTDKFGRRDSSRVVGTNPCGEILLRANEFCVTGSTPIITKSGIIDIKDLEDKTVDVWNGEEWSEVTVVKTRENASLVRVTISDGSTLDCTPDHKFSVKDRFSDKWSQVEARNLMSSSRYSVQIEPTTIVQDDDGVNVDESYTLGFAVGDGCSYGGVVFVDLYGDKDQSCPVTGTRYKKYLPKKYNLSRQRVRTNIDPEFFGSIRDNFREVSTWNKNSALNFIAGLADADGSETGTGGIRIYISAEDRAKDLQLILTRFGIRSSVNLLAKAGKRTNLGTRKRDLWYLQITDPRDIPCFRLNVSKGHSARFKGKYQNVRSVDILDTTEDVYCFNEPKRHMAVFGNILTYQCNLTEVVIDEKDTEETLKDKIRLATILGTWQSSLTNFKYIRKSWKDNCEEERLLGVSLTGIFGNPITGTVHKGLGDMLDRLRESAVEENKKEAEILGINASVAITTVKPSGTVSQLTGVSSGIHPWYSEYYIRTVRADNKDPLTAFLKDFNVPNEPDVMKPEMTTVFSFPIKSPKNAVVTKNVSAIEHLEIWKVYRTHWTEHNPSVTISVKEDEWLDVGAWVFRNFNSIGGVSFLPASEHSYKQAPYQEITKDRYEELLSKMPKNIPWQSLPLYELEDNTIGSQELACAAGADSCDVVDLVSA